MPKRIVTPDSCYLVCATQRSGSFLLLEALKNSGLAGRPEEYFLTDGPDAWEQGRWARRHGVSTRAEFLRLVLEHGTSANGVFGAKLMWNDFDEAVGRLRALPGLERLDAAQLLEAVLPNLHYIWLVRRDHVRQAVSWSKAAQTGSYAWDMPAAAAEPVFDVAQIRNMIALIEAAERGWAEFFRRSGAQPFQVVYEEFVEAYEQTAVAILRYLHVPVPETLAFGERRMQRQADAINEDWVRRYHEIARRSQG